MITVDDIEAAARRLGDTCRRTPVLPLTTATGGQLLLKAESLQRTGSFKLRGATNAVRRLPARERRYGVITHSSGNHGQAVAAAAAAEGIPARVVMPADAPEVKIAATRSWGADVVLVPAAERIARCAEIAERTGARVIPPYDDCDVIAGQGTIGLEILQQVPDLDTVLVPVGGGGLISGIALAVKAYRPAVQVVAAEPELAADLAESFQVGRRVRWDAARTGRTVADGVRSTAVGELNWHVIRQHVERVVTVDERAVLDAMRTVVTGARIVVEPSGAVAPAAYLSRPHESFGPTVAIVSGSNVDRAVLRAALA